MKRTRILAMAGAMVILTVALLMLATAGAADSPLTAMERLGKRLLFDTNLSTPMGVACAACHGPDVGYTGPDSAINAAGAVYPGAVLTRAGNRKPPAAAYAGDSPVLHFDEAAGTWVGGMFWDGRATGNTLGDPLAEQAMGPFLNPLEQNNPNKVIVCTKVRNSNYALLFRQVWGSGSLSCTEKSAPLAYERIALSIAAYERSAEVSAFTSKFDAFWDQAKADALDVTLINVTNWGDYAGLGLGDDELQGLALFNTTGKCSGCHVLDEGSAGYPLFTDFTYDNLGVPKNPKNPYYTMPRKWNPSGAAWVDLGLGGYLKGAGYAATVYEQELGKFKVPTLRNVDLRPSLTFVKAYSHNGYFKSLKEITHFYNTRDVAGSGWPAPEYAATVNHTELGNLGLSSAQEDLIVLFMETLSDGYVAP